MWVKNYKKSRSQNFNQNKLSKQAQHHKKRGVHQTASGVQYK